MNSKRPLLAAVYLSLWISFSCALVPGSADDADSSLATGFVAIGLLQSGIITSSNNGTETDSLTGLVWAKCVQSDTVSATTIWDPERNDCTGGTAGGFQFCNESDNDCNGGTDTGTLGPPWLNASGSVGASEGYEQCAALRMGDRTDWRTPTRYELSYFHYSFFSSNPDLFPQTPATRHWTASGSTLNLFNAFTVNFNTGSITNTYDKTTSLPLRCVSGTKTGGGRSQLTDNNDGTVSDAVSGLVWAKCVQDDSGGNVSLWNAGPQNCAGGSGTAGSFQYCNANDNTCNGGADTGTLNGGGTSGVYATCNGMTLGGRNDWRVPTQTELRNFFFESWLMNDSLFPNTPQMAVPVHATASSGSSSQAQTLNFISGATQLVDKTTASFRVRCVAN